MKQSYNSKYTDRKVTAAQKMAEIMCENLARKEHLALPLKFWNTPKWEKHFKLQLMNANSLLKLYSAEVIFRSLRDYKASNIYSLNAPFLDDILKREKVKLEKEIKEIESMPVPEVKVVVNEQPRKVFVKKSILSTLEELEDGEKG